MNIIKKIFRRRVKPLHILEYLIFWILVFLVRLLPLHYVHRAGFLLARIFSPLLKSRKRVAIENLSYAFPEWSASKKEKIADQSLQNIAATFVELLWQKKFKPEDIKKRVRIKNFELFKKIYSRNKGVIFLTAHFGSWELAIQSLIVYSSIPVYAIVRQQSNALIDRVITKWREMFGGKVIPAGIAVRKIIQTLHSRGVVAIIADQSAPKESISVEFFGREVPTYEGPAVFSLKTGAPIIFGCTVRQPDGNYVMNLVEIPTDDLKGYTPGNMLELTKRQVKITENIIRQHPEQWMWMHKRWKHAK